MTRVLLVVHGLMRRQAPAAARSGASEMSDRELLMQIAAQVGALQDADSSQLKTLVV